MKVPITCPRCGHAAQANLDMLGRRVRCKHCRRSFTAIGDDDSEVTEDLSREVLLGLSESASGRSPAATDRPG